MRFDVKASSVSDDLITRENHPAHMTKVSKGGPSEGGVA